MKTRQRLLAVLLLVIGPVWFALASGPAERTPAERQEVQNKDDQPPAQKQPPPLAEMGPRPQPVPQPSPADIDASVGKGVDFLVHNQNKNGSCGPPPKWFKYL